MLVRDELEEGSVAPRTSAIRVSRNGTGSPDVVPGLELLEVRRKAVHAHHLGVRKFQAVREPSG